MMTAEVDKRIAGLRAELAEVHGSTCEVHKRIVGYYRNVKNFNKGKAEELVERVHFLVPGEKSP